MPKPKRFLHDAAPKKKSKQPQPPATADEYLAAGVDFEEAGEKWRGGDAAKAGAPAALTFVSTDPRPP